VRRITFEVPDWMERTALHEVSGLAHVTEVRVEVVPEPHLVGHVEPSRDLAGAASKEEVAP